LDHVGNGRRRRGRCGQRGTVFDGDVRRLGGRRPVAPRSARVGTRTSHVCDVDGLRRASSSVRLRQCLEQRHDQSLRWLQPLAGGERSRDANGGRNTGASCVVWQAPARSYSALVVVGNSPSLRVSLQRRTWQELFSATAYYPRPVIAPLPASLIPHAPRFSTVASCTPHRFASKTWLK